MHDCINCPTGAEKVNQNATHKARQVTQQKVNFTQTASIQKLHSPNTRSKKAGGKCTKSTKIQKLNQVQTEEAMGTQAGNHKEHMEHDEHKKHRTKVGKS